MKLNLNIKKAGLLVLGVVAGSVVFAQKTDTKGNVLGKEANKKDTVNTLNAQQKNSASISDGVSASSSVFGIRGKVIDVETMKPIAGVSISLSDNSKVTSTNANGEFIIPVNKKGEYSIVSSYLGYNKEITPVVLEAKNWEMVSVVLVNESSTLDEVVVTRRRVQASEFALLEERKNSNLFVEKIGAQELSRKGVSDAEGALTKMSGVTKSASGANVFVRGLGDRYNSTTLNGLALPSEDPLNKNISLDFFGTNVIQSVGVNKTFNPLLIADVAGANIDIVSKELNEDASLELSLSSGINTQAVNADNFKRVDGTNWFGSLNQKKSPITSLSNYDFSNNWNPKNMETPINSSFSIIGGKRFRIGENNLNVLLIGNMTSDYKYAEGIIRQTTNDGTISLDQKSTLSNYNVSKTAMANLKYSFGKHYLAFNSLYINDQSQEFESNIGYKLFDVKDNGYFRRSHVIDNHLLVNQLLSKLDLTDSWKLDLGLGYNVVKSDEPDRRTLEMLDVGQTGSYRLFDTYNFNERYFSDLNENGLSAKAIATYKFVNDNDYDRKIEFGYNGNLTSRDFNAVFFGHKRVGSMELGGIDIEDMDGIFGHNPFSKGEFTLYTGRDTDLTPYWYKGTRNIHSAIVSGTYQFTEKFTALLGLRYDNVFQEITYDTNIGNSDVDGDNEIKKNYVLPSANLKYELNEKSNLRASASMSYTLPQFIETAYFKNTYSTGSVIGYQGLKPVENTNFDIKWELFPSKGELLSVGAFYKNLKNPIARVESSGNVLTYRNVGSSAQVAGVEIELKKNLLSTTTANGENILSAGANVSYLYSSQKLENPTANFTEFNGTSKLQGASPLLLNADVSYLLNGRNWNWTSTVVLNYFSDRVFAIGTQGYKNVIEKSIPTLDFISNVAFNKRWGANIKARNILNPAIRLERESDKGENITLKSIKRGADFSVGVSYKF
ncbi:Outer membrane receptor proteins, mostly Fe transport [Sphingobacterium nematocida]|uniref:Outer membrane receptor proteins, mostly Fe transport n=1 Tax=Sphingobacterium nematocida TaxID=1513896 RepID=A0A1T5FVU7_9SPHI|nr:TonB-dependent receptor [Sphingobacterium nematocida]SKC00305.1 Outer membrane receptor proteins, mostly Fe transport [Sphingobacterium nematocida]